MKTQRIKTKFAGITFTGFAYGDDFIKVPIPAFKKILKSGNVKAKLRYHIEADGNGENDKGPEDISVHNLLAILDSWKDDKPSLLALRPSEKAIFYSPYRQLSYQVSEKEKNYVMHVF